MPSASGHALRCRASSERGKPPGRVTLRGVASHPLVPQFTGVAVPMGAVLDRQVELLREAHGNGDPVAVEVLRGTGTVAGTDQELLGAELTLETARLAIARDHRFGDWAAAAHGRRDVVEFLLRQGPDLSITEPVCGATARGAARHLGHVEIAALF
jgi:hypothetical protein